MSPTRVLVAFSSRSGSTAGTAEAIASVLRSAGFLADCRAKEEVDDVSPYRAVVLGSGVFVPSRASDGGGFLERHAAGLRGRDVWLYSTGPIGGRAGRGGDCATDDELAAVTVGRAIGARGVAMFGTVGMPDGDDPVASLLPADRREVRSWAAEIATALSVPRTPHAYRRGHRHHVAAAG
jgi:menaquinone-dependent protoporphyrinogen oxidase